MSRHVITIDELDGFEIDEADGRLYWKGKGVVLERKISLEGWTLVLAVIGAASAAIAALWPIIVHIWL